MKLAQIVSGVSFGLGIFVAGCRGDANQESTKYGEPVVIRVPASAGVPGYETAVAVSEGTDVAPLVTELAALIHIAVTACPDVTRPGDHDEVLQITFSVERAALRGVNAKGPSESCISRALEGKHLAQDKLAVLIQLRPLLIADASVEAP